MRYSLWQTGLIILVVITGFYAALPNVFPTSWRNAIPSELRLGEIGLGLDLQGGIQLQLAVGVDEVITEQLNAIANTLREDMRSKRIRYRNMVVSDSVRFSLIDAADADQLNEMIRGSFNVLELSTDISEDTGLVTIALTPTKISEVRSLTMAQSISVVQRRIDALGTRNPVVQQQGKERIILELPGVTNAPYVKSLLGQTARLTFHRVYNGTNTLGTGNLPQGVSMFSGRAGSGQLSLPLYENVEIGGDRLQDASPSYQDGAPVVSFRFDSLGGRQFGELTTNSVGQQIAIVLDDEVISAPVVNEPILGGSGIITGRFSTQESFDLALLLRTGALPAPLDVVAEHTVGPSLGLQSINLGKIAGAVGLILVALFMILAYGKNGWFAVIALTVNLVLLTGALSFIQASLTLPGIVGIILTIGMAVDANVLIFERIREELISGKKPLDALRDGFSKATLSIVDANITTVIAGVIMFALGEGPVKGFAITLTVGIATSMFSAVVLLRYLMVQFIVRRRAQQWLAPSASFSRSS